MFIIKVILTGCTILEATAKVNGVTTREQAAEAVRRFYGRHFVAIRSNHYQARDRYPDRCAYSRRD